MIRLATLTLLIVSRVAVAQAGESMDETIQKWIRQLDSDRFAEREQATRSLVEAGRKAIPAVAEAASSRTLETRHRAFEILRTLLDSLNLETRREAIAALEGLAASGREPVSQTALKLLSPPPELLAWIERVGGEYEVDESAPHKPVVELRLDRTRGIDPGFFSDPVSDEDLISLKPLRELRVLTLESRTRLTDAALKHVGALIQLENLRFLYLTRTRVTDAALEHLRHLSALEHLDLRNTLVTEAGVAKLQKALPHCRISAFE